MIKSHCWILCFLLGATITASLVCFAGMAKGPGTTPDSFNYLHAGLSLFNEGELKNVTNRPFIEWPPLYPILISGIYAITSDLIKGVFWFQVLVAGLTVYLGGVLAQKFIQNQIILGASFLAIVFSTPIILVNHFIWSESFFSLLFIVHLLLLYNYISSIRSSYWYILVLTGVLMCLQRHVGVFMVLGTLVVLLQYPQSKMFQRRLFSSILYGILTLIPLIGWWTRNLLIRGQVINDYSSSLFTVNPGKHWLAYQNVFTAWFLPDEIPVWLRVLAVGLLLSFLGYKYYKQKIKSELSDQVFISFIIIFLSYYLLTYAASFVVNEYLDDRILAPIYLLGIILVFHLLDKYYSSLNVLKSKKVLLFSCLLWVAYPITRSIFNTWIWHKQEKQINLKPVNDNLN